MLNTAISSFQLPMAEEQCRVQSAVPRVLIIKEKTKTSGVSMRREAINKEGGE